MSAILILALTNAVLATGMFAIVAACRSRIHNPAVMHWLWILVLLKLLTPPLWSPQFALLPAVEPAAGFSADTTVSRHTNPGVASEQILNRQTEAQSFNPARPEGFLNHPSQGRVSDDSARPDGWRRTVTASISPLLIVVVIWGAGIVLLWGLAVWRISRLQRCLRFAQEAPGEVQQTTALLAERLGLRRCPRVWQVPGRMSPMLWAFVGPARIVVPSELFSELDGPARQTLLLHELVHYRRGDQWIRCLELVSLGLYWWHPIAWLLRREIRLAEEMACDAWVVAQRPTDRRAYAEMLVKTVAFLSSDDLPLLATGVATEGSIEKRLRKIMHSAFDIRVSRRMRVLICLMAILFLPLAPILVRAQRADAESSAAQQTAATSSGDSAGQVVAIGNNTGRVDELIGTVVNEEGKAVAGAEVIAFLDGQRVEGVMKSNESGQFRIPRSWHPDDLYDSHAVLFVRQGDSRMGWLDLRGLLPSSSAMQKTTAPNDSFRIILRPRTQAVRGTLLASKGRRLGGKVLDSDSGKPLAKISVGYYGSARSNSGAACMMTRTKADGTFEFHVPPGVSKIYIAEGGREPHSESRRTLEVPADRDLVDVVLRAGQKDARTRSFKEVTKAGKKIPGRTDNDRAPDSSPPYKVHVTLHTPAGQRVDGVGARVVRKNSQYPYMWVALSAAGNDVSFNRDLDGATMFLVIDADGYAMTRSAEFVVRERMPNLDVELVPEARVPVRGRVVDRAGKAVEGARVRIARRIYGNEQEFPWGLEYTTGNEGQFEIKQARIGDRIQVRIDMPGTGGAESEWMSIEGNAPRILPDLHVGSPNQEVGGIVRDYDGFAVENAKVIHTGEPLVDTTTDAEGKFRLAGLPTGSVSLKIESAGFPPDVRQACAGRLDNEIHVNRTAAQDENDYQVTVTLRPGDSKEVSHATLFFCVENGDLLMSMPERKGITHQIGFARMVRRYKGKQFAVVVAADGYARSKPVIVPNQKGPHTIVVDLEPAAPVTLRGSVVDDVGRPVADAKIGLSISLNDQAADEPWRYFNSREKLPVTGVDGKFVIADVLRNSRVAVYVNKPGYSGAWSARVTTDNPDGVELPALRLSPATGELSGRVVDEQGHPVSDAAVSVHDLGRIVTNTDDQGRFRLQKVPNKEIWLRVQAESGEWTQKITPDASDLKVKLQTHR